MRKFIIASFSLALLVSASDAQLFRRARQPAPVVEQVPAPTTVDKKKQPPTPIVEPVQQADAGRGGKIRDFIKRLLGR